MPGLPTRDTLKRFNKFCKGAKKSRTNTMSGAYDTSKQKISTKENMITKFKNFVNEDLGARPELIESIRAYLLNEYPSDWWNNEFRDRVNDYITEDDIVGYGDSDDPETWDYEDEEDAYRNLATGGAIEYDIIGEIGKDIINKFNLKDYDEYFNLRIDDIVEEHMCNMIDWYDHFIFGKDKRDPSDPFGFNKGVKDLMSGWDELEKSKDEEGRITLKDGTKLKI